MIMNDIERKICEEMNLPPDAVKYLEDHLEESENEYKIFVENVSAGVEALTQAICDFAAAITALLEAVRRSLSAVDFEELAALAVKVEKIKPRERARPRPARNTINKQYMQPVLAVRHTARSRLR